MKINYIFKLFISIWFTTFLCSGIAKAAIHNDFKPEDNYLLAIGVCPPWKKGMETYCKNAVHNLETVLKKRLGLPQKNIYTVLDKEATYEGLKKAFTLVKNNTNSNSRVIIYLNAHGGAEPDENGNNPSAWQTFLHKRQEKEMFVLWTKERPITIEDALENKQWILASDVRKMLDKISGEKIVIIDACHSGIAINSFIEYDKQLPLVNQREAFIFSSEAISVAETETIKKLPLFTSYLVEGIAHKSNLEEAFKYARWSTLKKALINIIDNPAVNKACIFRGGKDVCVQLPGEYDSKNYLKEVVFIESEK